MGHRLSRIVTRTGDGGTTGLGDGSRVDKDAPRIHALGEVDELNCLVGVLMAEPLPPEVAEWLTAVQHDLFDLGSEIAVPGFAALTEARVLALEAWVEAVNRDLPMLKEFILPGGTRAAALAHQARAVCRRAERTLVSLAKQTEISTPGRQYLNRLSDLLFVLARHLNRLAGQPDILWRPRRED
ncbi:MAG: cob(I)yrinic acid a,c-diamide adenosyltransferase [Paludibacterium sp.]|uniref:cob(I)yrinic acid a,c-diamide adenosyltransferase n=1 Tax=Paludibacterium sp. TaxID=1917523 RepID=UPI0025E46514|nr:cob(I)yrinic acid a,c-diamide adenosyltransferase [Paludibacterium sp.]MBV8046341.1 cob(I)yrinic acid a,c-diamide adenosyltransferase [Paludibacterium sp.]MBV8649543.1 cob(I)yrinic acid a,c-diamide adenosyltransferase [Paludibacterium sp.]